MRENSRITMSVIGKFVLNKDLVKVHKFFRSRTIHLSKVNQSDQFILKGDHNPLQIPELTIPEVIFPKFKEFSNYTALVSTIGLIVYQNVSSSFKYQ